MDDEISTFGDHETFLITIRSSAERVREQAKKLKGLQQLNSDTRNGANEAYNDVVLLEVLDDEVDDFDIALVQESDILEPIAEGHITFTLADLIAAQKGNGFCQKGTSRQDRVKDSSFFEDKQDLL